MRKKTAHKNFLPIFGTFVGFQGSAILMLDGRIWLDISIHWRAMLCSHILLMLFVNVICQQENRCMAKDNIMLLCFGAGIKSVLFQLLVYIWISF
jgi:hypothetical protein